MLIRLVLLFAVILYAQPSHADKGETQKPVNVVFILADDLGWNDTDIYQENTFLETPNIEKLASQGLIFRNAYSNSPLCSPTRASILTGQTPSRHGSTHPVHHLDRVVLSPQAAMSSAPNKKSTSIQSVSRLDTSIPTLSSLLKQAHYQTAHFGKWHLGSAPYSPLDHGFDVDIPNYPGAGPTGGYLAPWQFAPNLLPQVEGEHIDVRLAKEAVKWMNDVKDKGPFYLNFWAFSVHGPFNADPELIDYFEGKRKALQSQQSSTYAAMVKQFDDAIGILHAGLIDAGLASNTIIVFTSDNGGNHYAITDLNRPTSNFPLRAGKASIFNGGIRVPSFVVWPGVTQPNTLTNAPVQSVDFFPTILNALSVDWPASHQIDGHDLKDILTANQNIHERAIHVYYPYDPKVPDWIPSSVSVIDDNWKLIRSFHYGEEQGHLYYLFNLKEDPFEQINLSASRFDKVAQLDRLIEEHLLEVKAVQPLLNPNFDPTRFDYESIGVPADNFAWFTDAPQRLSKLTLSVDLATVEAGNTVNLSYTINDDHVAPKIHYAQFMGTEVELRPSNDGFSFTAPTVYVPEFIGFAFQVMLGDEIINKQIAVELMPVQIPPTIASIQDSKFAIKGQDFEFYVDAEDANKERLTISLISDDVQSIKVDPFNNKAFSIPIPSDFDKSSIRFIATADDGTDSTEAIFDIRVLSQDEADALTAEPDKRGGGMHPILLCFLISVLIFRSARKRLKLVPKS